MKKILLILVIVLGLAQITKGQVVSCVPCDQLGMVINVGSQETSISIYHSGQYMTHPREYNVFVWEFSDQQGNLLHQDTLVDASTISFGHSWSLTDTIDVTVSLVNDSAILPNGNSINCLFEDQLYWKIDTFPSGTPYGMWTFIYNNPGVDLNTQTGIDNFVVENKRLIKVVDFLGRKNRGDKNKPLLYIYDDGTTEKKIILE
ncbi:MAG: hypothetical protein CMO63_05315 [Verrucomicrobiales bacterium]|nr:hypothetical protein [Verrucomicrobiales bacterium]|tara:strand:+ start:896 stop:1504 length:609 start_codon:yes stop_codon:yes gene_type:complete